MTIVDAVNFIQTGGTIVALIIGIWLIGSRRIVTMGEFNEMKAVHKEHYDELKTLYTKLEKLADTANDELRKQSATNARLVELSFDQRRETERVRHDPPTGERR